MKIKNNKKVMSLGDWGDREVVVNVPYATLDVTEFQDLRNRVKSKLNEVNSLGHDKLRIYRKYLEEQLYDLTTHMPLEVYLSLLRKAEGSLVLR